MSSERGPAGDSHSHVVDVNACPLPQSADVERITLAYGEGGWLTRRLIRDRLLSRFGNESLNRLGDAALLSTCSPRIAVSTDSYTVSPLFFPGGDIGKLAVCGTVNDLAVSGAEPRWLTLALLIEEGLPWRILDDVLDSIQRAANEAGVSLVTGDTKVVPKGAVDGLFLNTTGIGQLDEALSPGPEHLVAGDPLIATGPIGQHGAAILCTREAFDFEPPPVSDCASLAEPMRQLWSSGLAVRAARDATRGGVAAVLQEWSAASGLGCTLDEASLPIRPEVRAVCELLGLDALHLACEGAAVVAVAPDAVHDVLGILQSHPACAQATVIGRVTESRQTPVRVVRITGREVPLDEPAGSPLPRIC